MPTELTVSYEDPIALAGSLDVTGALQLIHVSDSLADYSQTLEAEHSDFQESGGTVRIKVFDFEAGGDAWSLTASHDSGNTSWTRASDHSYYDVGLITGLLEVDVVATSDASPPQQQTRKIWIKTTPTDPLPDDPRPKHPSSHAP